VPLKIKGTYKNFMKQEFRYSNKLWLFDRTR